jgi:Fe-S cluster biogenesis protein NfuA
MLRETSLERLHPFKKLATEEKVPWTMLARLLSAPQSSPLVHFVRCFAYATPEVYKKVTQLIDEQIRPAIQQDGGDIELHDIVDGVMIVSLSGACQSCGRKKGTLHHGVLGFVQDHLPEIVGIREKLEFEDL